jgi:hypothetical protein
LMDKDGMPMLSRRRRLPVAVGLLICAWTGTASAADDGGGADWGEDTSHCSPEDLALCDSTCATATCGAGVCTSATTCTGYCPVARPGLYCSCGLPCTNCRPGTDLCSWICDQVSRSGPSSVVGICMAGADGTDITALRCGCESGPADDDDAGPEVAADDAGAGDSGVDALVDETASSDSGTDVLDAAPDSGADDEGTLILASGGCSCRAVDSRGKPGGLVIELLALTLGMLVTGRRGRR